MNYSRKYTAYIDTGKQVHLSRYATAGLVQKYRPLKIDGETIIIISWLTRTNLIAKDSFYKLGHIHARLESILSWKHNEGGKTLCNRVRIHGD